jgi:uncharacterized membrane protein YjdF
MEKRMRLIGALATVALIAFALAAKTGSTYKIAPVFLLPLLWLPYFLRRRLHLHPLHYLLYALALFLHNFGALGYYQRGVFGLSFDIYVHFYFGVVGGLLTYRLLDQTLPMRPWPRAVATVLLVLGAGAIHEEIEWFSTLLLGPERGMLKTPAQGVYIFDTQRDMFNNLIGAIVAVTLYVVVRRARRPAEGPGFEVIESGAGAVPARP